MDAQRQAAPRVEVDAHGLLLVDVHAGLEPARFVAAHRDQREVRTLATPLVRRLDPFARQATLVIVAVGAATFLYGHYVAGMPTLDAFLAVVGLAVAATPEGLPAIVTIVLAIGTRTMARRRALVRRLPAVETLGSVTVICSDKTGTLTRNEMTAVRVSLPGRELRVTGIGYAPEGRFHDGARHVDPQGDIGLGAMLCNDARIEPDDTGGWQLTGDPTEGALLALAHKAGLDPADAAQRFPRVDEVPFGSDRRYMATLHRDHDGRRFVRLKGAPEPVLALCEREHGVDGPLDAAPWHACIERAAGAGERDIVPCFERLDLVGIVDLPRDGAIGNLIGSSIYNVLVILGLTCVAAPDGLDVSRDILWIDLPLAALVAIVCLPVFRSERRVSRAEGGAFIGAYLLYFAGLLATRA